MDSDSQYICNPLKKFVKLIFWQAWGEIQKFEYIYIVHGGFDLAWIQDRMWLLGFKCIFYQKLTCSLKSEQTSLPSLDTTVFSSQFACMKARTKRNFLKPCIIISPLVLQLLLAPRTIRIHCQEHLKRCFFKNFCYIKFKVKLSTT